MIIYIVICLVVILFLLWIYIRFDSNDLYYEETRRQRVNETIEWLYKAVNDICYHCNMSPVYTIKETSHITYAEKEVNRKGKIYLAVWDEQHARVFSPNTLMYAILHEITHILSPCIHHEPPFDSIETILLNKAIELGYYNPNIPIEPGYLTLDLTKKNEAHSTAIEK